MVHNKEPYLFSSLDKMAKLIQNKNGKSDKMNDSPLLELLVES